MSALVDRFHERLVEVEAYLEFLQTVEDQAQHGPPRLEGAANPISVKQQRILYSSVYLQLYNLIESTMSSCFEAVEEAALDQGRWKPGDLSESLRREWVRSIARTHDSLTSERRLKKTLHLCEILVDSHPVSEFTIEKGGGGSWDDAAIEAFSKRVGCDLDVSLPVFRDVKRPFRDELGPLALVKRFRNELAHGSISFAQCAEEMTVGRLVELKDKTVAYLLEVLRCFSTYIASFHFLVPERRPT